jgi:putative membrane protein
MMENEQKEWGFHAFIRGIILFGFSMLLLSFILSGGIKYYIAPKMMPFIYFALVIFLILSIVQILRSTPKGQEREMEFDCGTSHQMSGSRFKKIAVYSIFIFPLIMGFVIPEKVLDSSVAAKRGVQLGSGQYSRPAVDTSSQDGLNSTEKADQFLSDIENGEEPTEHFTYDELSSGDGFDDYYSDLAKELQKEEIIVVKEDTYLDIMTIFDMYLEEFKGKKVEMMGFVYREEGVAEDEMVVARFSMTCCTADSAVYGLLVRGEETKKYREDTWVRITGTLDQSEYDDWIIPIIQLDTIEEVETPETPYVYPNFLN